MQSVERQRSTGGRFGRGLVVGLLAPVLLTGCARSLTIRQDPYINTASQANRPADKRTGDPLELTIVCVYPADLKKPGNEALQPDSKITSKEWYDRRPEVGLEKSAGRFDLPANQIYVLTNADKVYGRRIGSALRGAAFDGDRPIQKTGIDFKWDALHGEQSVIYVFPKFIGASGGVLPVPPAKLHPPGAYDANVEIKIGLHADRPPEDAQYVEVLSPRKLHGGAGQ